MEKEFKLNEELEHIQKLICIRRYDNDYNSEAYADLVGEIDNIIKEFIRIFKKRSKEKYYCYDCIDETLDFLDKLVGDI